MATQASESQEWQGLAWRERVPVGGCMCRAAERERAGHAAACKGSAVMRLAGCVHKRVCMQVWQQQASALIHVAVERAEGGAHAARSLRVVSCLEGGACCLSGVRALHTRVLCVGCADCTKPHVTRQCSDTLAA